MTATSSTSEGRLPAAIHGLEGFLFATLALLLLQYPFERTLTSNGYGIVSLERASADGAADIVPAWGGSHGMGAGAAREQLLIDFVFIVAYVGAVVAVCWYVRICSRLLGPPLRKVVSAVTAVVAAAAGAAGALDAIENAVLFRILNGHHESAARYANPKFVLILVAGAVALVGLVLSLFGKPVRGAWVAAHRGLGHRLLGLRAEQPSVVIPPLVKGTTKDIAICCSGGGIRSASFNLGVLQFFMRADQKVYQKAAVITAVSGGSYIASAISLTRRYSDPGALTAESPAFAAGSPEERRLRTHMHYLIPDKRVAGVGVLALLYGFTTNLGVLLAASFVGSRVLGWCLHLWSGAKGFDDGRPELGLATWTWVTPLAVGGAGLICYVLGEKILPSWRAWVSKNVAPTDQLTTALKESIRSWALRFVAAGALGATLLLGVPGAILGLNRLALDNRPTRLVAAVISDFGFTTNRGCLEASKQSFTEARDEAINSPSRRVKNPEPAKVAFEYGACGQTFAGYSTVKDPYPPPTAAGAFDEQGKGPGSGIVATLLSLLALIKTTAGKVTPTTSPAPTDGGDGSGTAESDSKKKAGGAVRRALGSLPAVIRHTLAPWLGTILVTALLVVLSLRLAEDAMLSGISFTRLWHVMAVLAVLFVLPFGTDANRTSLHAIYRERLSTVFAVKRTTAGTAEQVPYEIPLRWSDMPGALREGDGPANAKVDAGTAGPELIVCATANAEDVGFVPPGRGGAPWAFSRSAIGIGASDLSLWALTPDFEAAAGPGVLTVPASVAISGAAVSPVMGRMTRRPVRLLLGLANVRLGVWLPNPMRVPRGPAAVPSDHWWGRGWTRALAQWRAPGVTFLAREVVGRNSIRRRYLYVTDGGHYDNLGLVEALRRQPALTYVVDGSGDTPPTWTTLGHAISLARSELGADIVLDKEPPAPRDGVVASNVITAKVTYSDGSIGRLVIGKLVRTTTTSYDLHVYAHDDPSFPNKSTADQLFGDLEFESYRQFGQLTGALMVGQATVPPAGEDSSLPELVDQLVATIQAAGGINGSIGLEVDLATDQQTLTFQVALDG